MSKNICIIPLRSKSKEVKNKNIKLIKGLPLCMYVLKTAINSGIFSEVVVASDSINYFRKIKKFSKKISLDLKNVSFFVRSKKSSTDISPTEEVIKEVLIEKKFFKYCYLIQATSPLIKIIDLKKGEKLLYKKKCDSLFSSYESKKFIWRKIGKKILPINYNFAQRPMRQNYLSNYVENGAFYAFSVKKFFTKKSRLFNKISTVIMPKERSLEIDSLEDFNNVQKLI